MSVPTFKEMEKLRNSLAVKLSEAVLTISDLESKNKELTALITVMREALLKLKPFQLGSSGEIFLNKIINDALDNPSLIPIIQKQEAMERIVIAARNYRNLSFLNGLKELCEALDHLQSLTEEKEKESA